MDETYPSIVEKAKKEDCTIYWEDEIGINNQGTCRFMYDEDSNSSVLTIRKGIYGAVV